MDRIFIHLGKFFFKFRNNLFPTLYLCLLVFTTPGAFLRKVRLDRYICILGISVVLLGQLFRMLVIGFAYIKRGGKHGEVYATSLVQSGFYAHVRNPMYIGNYLIMLGFLLLYGSLWGYVLALPFFTCVYYSIIRAEEEYLKKQFTQEYEDYAARVNRFIPNFKGIRRSLEGYRYDWKKVLRKEYCTLSAVSGGILAVVIWKEITIFGQGWRSSEVMLLLTMFLPIGLFFGVIRYLKKTGRLKTIDPE